MHAFPQSPPGRFDLRRSHSHPAEHPQCHRQHERKPRRDLSKKINDLVHGKYRQKAAEHHQKSRCRRPQHQSVDDGFQGDFVTDKIGRKIRHAKVIIRRIHPGIQQDQRHQAQIEDQSALSSQLHRPGKRRRKRNSQENRMTKQNDPCQRCRKIYQIDHRMITAEFHNLLRFHKSILDFDAIQFFDHRMRQNKQGQKYRRPVHSIERQPRQIHRSHRLCIDH